VQVSE
jgi:hypothetical protein